MAETYPPEFTDTDRRSLEVWLEALSRVLEVLDLLEITYLIGGRKRVGLPLRADDFSRAEFARRLFLKSHLFGDEPLEFAMATAEDTILRKLVCGIGQAGILRE